MSTFDQLPNRIDCGLTSAVPTPALLRHLRSIMPARNANVSARVTPAVREQLTKIATSQGRNVSELVAELVDGYLQTVSPEPATETAEV